MTTKYLFFDLDGTLKGKSRELTEKNKAALLALKEKGHRIFLCSGRSPEFLRRSICLELPFDGIVGCAGGSVLIKNQCIFENAIPGERLSELLALFEEFHIDYSLETTIGLFLSPGIAEAYRRLNEEMARRNPEAAKANSREENTGVNHPAAEFFADPRTVQKICFMVYSPKSRKAFLENVEKDFYAVFFFGDDSFTFGEIIPKTATKARGIQAVLEYYGADVRDSLGFGDSMNDYQMMEYVGTKVVYEEGPEELRSLADYYFTDPDQDGIAKVLGEIFPDL